MKALALAIALMAGIALTVVIWPPGGTGVDGRIIPALAITAWAVLHHHPERMSS